MRHHPGRTARWPDRVLGRRRLRGASACVFRAERARIATIWKVVDEQLRNNKFVSGENISMADIMLSVYSNWNNFFPGLVDLGENSIRMIREVSSRPAFKKAIELEKIKFKV